ncbi:MAG: cobalt ABC transporter permease [Verrucomicrobia bacterium]|nr:cobalt ABC transporter permease [Verrucomicrobiota bacterium]
MKKVMVLSALVLLCAAGLTFLLSRQSGNWAGVDEVVVEKIAKQAGRPARKPYINTDQGDLLLFFFLIAGTAGGFVGGYCFRELFPPEKKP